MPPVSMAAAAAAGLAAQHGDGRAPGALAADAPVGPSRDHGVDAVLALGRHPLGLLDPLDAQLPEAAALAAQLRVHGDEPLLGGPEQDRRLGAPAVGVAVGEALLVEEGAEPAQLLHHQGVALEDVLPLQLGVGHRREELPIGAHKLGDRHGHGRPRPGPG